MAITKDFNRQDLTVATVDIKLADLTSGVASNVAMDLPPNSVVDSGTLVVTEAFNSTLSDVIDVGDATTGNRYLAGGNIQATGLVALVPTGFIGTGEGLVVKWTSGGGTPTTGKLRLVVKYYILGRSEETLG